MISYTNQTAFDAVVSHARKQRVRAVTDTGQFCRYRTEEGLRCFIGALIPDEVYEKSMEGIGVDAFLGNKEGIGFDNHDVMALFAGTDIDLLYRLQRIHDVGMNGMHADLIPKEWEREFSFLAERFNLEYTPPGDEAPQV